jgi:hypothetical protein
VCHHPITSDPIHKFSQKLSRSIMSLEVSTVLKLINQRCSNIQRQTAFTNIREKSSLIFYYEIKLGQVREE